MKNVVTIKVNQSTKGILEKVKEGMDCFLKRSMPFCVFDGMETKCEKINNQEGVMPIPVKPGLLPEKKDRQQ